MRPPAPPELLARAAMWEDLTRWERAEVGRALRRLGWTHGEIRAVIPVPKGTLSGWCREIQLSTGQVEAIRARTHGSRRGVPVDTQWRRRLEIEEIEAAARAQVPELVTQPLWVAGVVLYWGEGMKTHRALAVANTDERLLRLFIAWTKSYLDANADFVLSLNLHADNDEPAARAHWASALDIPSPQFTKTFIKPNGTGHRKNHLPHGVCRVRVRRSTDAWVRALAWVDSLWDHLMGTETPPANLSLGSLAQPGRAPDS